MKKIIVLVILAITAIRCTELAELNGEEERIRNERGVECRYNKRGGVEDCRYRNWYSYINKWYKEWKYTENIIMNYINFFK